MAKYNIYEQSIKGSPMSGAEGRMNFSIINKLQAKVLKGKDTARKYQNVTWIENFAINGSYNFLADTQKLSRVSVAAFTKLFNQININANATLNPYDKRMINGKEVYYNELLWNNSKRIGTWTNAGIQMNTGLRADMFKKKQSLDTAGKIKDDRDKREFMQMISNPFAYVDFNSPWSVNVNYSLQYTRANYKTAYAQTFTLSGDFNLTPKWKIGCSSGYDFYQKKIAYTQFDISRLLHCWALNFSWIPDGIRKSFTFSLKVNSSMLQSLKVDKKRNWFDQ